MSLKINRLSLRILVYWLWCQLL